MNHEELLKALGKQAKEDELDQRIDRRWDQLSAGTLPVEEASRLRAEAGKSTEAEAAWEAFRPLDAEYRARLESRLAERIEGASRQRPPARPPLTERRHSAARKSRQWPGPGRLRGFRWWMGSGALAAAVLVVFLVRLWLPSSLQPVPHYTLSLEGEVRETRAESQPPAGVPMYEPGTRLRFVLKPPTTVRQPIAAAAYVAEDDGRTRSLEALTFTASTTGAVLMEGTVGSGVHLPPGQHTLLVVVGRPGHLPTAEELRFELAGLAEIATADWCAWRRSVSVRPSSTPRGYEQP